MLPDLSLVASLLLPQGRLVRAWNLTGGMSAVLTALEIETQDGRSTRCVLRCPGEAQQRENPDTIQNEYGVLQLGQAWGLPMPAPLRLLLPGEVLPNACLVMEYIAGQPDFSPADLDDYLSQMATALAQIHAATRGGASLEFLQRQPNAFPNPPEETTRAADLPRAPILAAWRACSPPVSVNETALLHGDYWPGNLLWKAGRLQAVIDWEDASLGDPLNDLGIARLEVVWMFGPPALPLFTEAYAAGNQLDFRALPYWDLCAALRLSRLVGSRLGEWANSFAAQGRPDLSPVILAERFGWFVEQALQGVR